MEQYTVHPPQVSTPLPFTCCRAAVGNSFSNQSRDDSFAIKRLEKELLPPGPLQANIRIRGLTSYRLEGKYICISCRFGAGEGMNCEAGSATTQSNPPPYECWGPGVFGRCRSPRQSLGLVTRQSLGLVTCQSLGLVSRQFWGWWVWSPASSGVGRPPVLGLVARQFLVARMFPSASVTLPHARV